MAGPHTARARARAQMLEQIELEALAQLAAEGAPSLSLRQIARELGLVSSGLYRYFASRDELLTALIVDAYADLAQAVEVADTGLEPHEYRRRWLLRCLALRAWARSEPARYQLIYGSPVPGIRHQRTPSPRGRGHPRAAAGAGGGRRRRSAGGRPSPTTRCWSISWSRWARPWPWTCPSARWPSPSARWARCSDCSRWSSVVTWSAGSSRPITFSGTAWTSWPTGWSAGIDSCAMTPTSEGQTQMKALQFSEYGGPEVLTVAEAPEPHAGPGQIRIAVKASSVNGMDWKTRSGMVSGGKPLEEPIVLGWDAAGVVDEVGEGVTDVSVGDDVLGQGSHTAAEYAVLTTGPASRRPSIGVSPPGPRWSARRRSAACACSGSRRETRSSSTVGRAGSDPWRPKWRWPAARPSSPRPARTTTTTCARSGRRRCCTARAWSTGSAPCP